MRHAAAAIRESIISLWFRGRVARLFGEIKEGRKGVGIEIEAVILCYTKTRIAIYYC